MNMLEECNNAFIFRYDYNECAHTVIDISKYLDGPYKLKILDNKGIDVCKYSKNYISDINMSESQNHFIENIRKCDIDSIDMKKYNRYFDSKKTELCDYRNEQNWALSFQLRGFNVHFEHTINDIKSIDNKTVRLIRKMLIRNDYCQETGEYGETDEYEETDDGETDEYGETDEDGDFFMGRKHKKREQKSEEKEHEKNLEIILQRILPKATDYNWLYIEYDSHGRTGNTIKERKIKDSIIYDLFNNDIKIATLITLSVCTSPNLTDFNMHSDEGAYECGVIFYKYGSYFVDEKKKQSDGIVLIGEQNSSVMYYGTAMEDNILIPDILHIENK